MLNGYFCASNRAGFVLSFLQIVRISYKLPWIQNRYMTYENPLYVWFMEVIFWFSTIHYNMAVFPQNENIIDYIIQYIYFVIFIAHETYVHQRPITIKMKE